MNPEHVKPSRSRRISELKRPRCPFNTRPSTPTNQTFLCSSGEKRHKVRAVLSAWCVFTHFPAQPLKTEEIRTDICRMIFLPLTNPTLLGRKGSLQNGNSAADDGRLSCFYVSFKVKMRISLSVLLGCRI